MDDYQLPEFAKGGWPVSKETADHMDKIAKEQQSTRAKANFIFGASKRLSDNGEKK